MKVFISWSGDRSKAVAELLDEWLQCVLQAIDPWMSSKDIDRGSLWFSELSDQLADTKLGIVCLTQDNKTKPWILFEAGALAKGLSSNRVCTFLVDLQPTDIANPLAQFNHTFPDKQGVFDLLRTINSSLGDKSLKERVLQKVFDTYWPQFESGFKAALETNLPSEEVPPRSDGSILEEVLTSVRRLDRRMRDIERTNVEPTRESLDPFIRRARREPSIPPDEAERMIKQFADDNLPFDIIVDILEGQGVPMAFVKRTYDGFVQDKSRRPAKIEEA
jgi:hypothetical protein